MQNLPFGVFRRAGSAAAFRGGVAIGDAIVDVGAAHDAGVFDGASAQAALACRAPVLNEFMAQGAGAWPALRLALSHTLRKGSPDEPKLRACLVPQARAEFSVPARIGDYTDFYTSVHHATNIGSCSGPTTR